MSYSIGQVADMLDINISTLRYYDKEGLFPAMTRSEGGMRKFSEAEIDALKVIECLKATGMSIKDIKQFMDWCKQGDATLQLRRDMFYNRMEAVQKQFEALQKTMAMIKYKCWYYDTALEAGSEKSVRQMLPDGVPEGIRMDR
mgnify:CR=1 FL=1